MDKSGAQVDRGTRSSGSEIREDRGFGTSNSLAGCRELLTGVAYLVCRDAEPQEVQGSTAAEVDERDS